jgi:hypothetical protein
MGVPAGGHGWAYGGCAYGPAGYAGPG